MNSMKRHKDLTPKDESQVGRCPRCCMQEGEAGGALDAETGMLEGHWILRRGGWWGGVRCRKGRLEGAGC